MATTIQFVKNLLEFQEEGYMLQNFATIIGIIGGSLGLISIVGFTCLIIWDIKNR